MGKRGKNRKTLTKVTPRSSDHIATPVVHLISILDRNPIFSFKHVDSKYCISKCDKKDRAAFAKTLIKLGKLTWKVIFNAPKEGVGFEKIPIGQCKPKLPGSITDDVVLIVFRYSGKKPMIGFKKDEIFYAIWFESNFGDVYDH